MCLCDAFVYILQWPFFTQSGVQPDVTNSPLIINICTLNSIRRFTIINKLRQESMSSPIIRAASQGTAGGLLDRLLTRGLLASTYPDSAEYHSKIRNILAKPTTVYAGFDATSDSLHIGNLVSIMNLLNFQRQGHRVICVVGDATAKIGDPSGHSEDRSIIDDHVIKQNALKICDNLKYIFNNHREYISNNLKMEKPMFLTNSQWYKDKNVISFIAEHFKQIRMGGLLHKKSLSERINSPTGMNLSEFCYQVFQAYDWLHLRTELDCRIQIGGMDQSGNIYTGHELIKKVSATDTFGLLTPIITNQNGKKIGKSNDSQDSTDSTVWLDGSKTSPFKLYQYFHRVPDTKVDEFLRIYTFIDDHTIEDMMVKHLKKPDDVWFCQRKLAEHVCLLLHGKQGLESAKKLTKVFYDQDPLELGKLNETELLELFCGNAMTDIIHDDELTALDIVMKSKCFKHEADALRIIQAGGVYLNNKRVMSKDVPITTDLILPNKTTVIRIGKKNYYIIKWH